MLVVTPAQVVAFRLARLGLRKRTSNLETAVGEVGLPDFPPGSALAALAARMSRPYPGVLADAFEQRSVVRLRAMRGAPIVARKTDYDVFALGMLPRDERSMRAFIGPAAKSVDAAGFSVLEAVEVVTNEAVRALARGPLDRDALHAELRRRVPKGLLPYCRGCDSHHVQASLLYAAALRGRLVVLPGEDGPYIVVRADRWFGRTDADARAAEAPAELLRRYLRAYGPSTVGHFAAWAGIGGGQPQAVWTSLADELSPVAIDGHKSARRWILEADRRKLCAARAEDTSVRIVSPGDPLLQMRDRELLVPKRELQRMIWKNLAPLGVVLAGTDVVATVRARKKKTTLTLNVHARGRVSAKLRAGIEEEASRLAKIRGIPELATTWSAED